MKTETKILGIIFIITIVLLFGGILLLSRDKGSSPKNSIVDTQISQIDLSKGQKIGSDSAKVKLVEFSDFECPACAAVRPYLDSLKRTYPNDVQLIFRHFPLPQHKYGKLGATLSEAAGEEGKFWEMHDKLFETQQAWASLSEDKARDYFIDLAKQLNLDEGKVLEALEKDTFKSKIDADVQEGQILKVNSTPTFFLNGRKLYLQSFDDLNTVINEELKK